MSTIDRDLVRAINSGRCFVLVGSGASCEIQLPTWHSLSEKTFQYFKGRIDKKKAEIVKNYIIDKNYPKVFGTLAQNIDFNEILTYIDSLLVVKNKKGIIYSHLLEWPFACYLSTNFDDALEIYAKARGLPLLSKKNTEEDLRYIRHDSSDIIFKIHGDTKDATSIVLTDEQYEAFRHDTSKKYWRNKILSVLNMVDLVILGYSVSDPDFQDQLERAKTIASPDHPIFMFTTGLTPEEMREYYLKYNIRVISYKNESGTHHELIKLLRRYNPFIAKRGGGNIGLRKVNETEATLAASMYLFTQLRLGDEREIYIVKIYASLILQILQQKFIDKKISLNELRQAIEKGKYFSSVIDIAALNKAVEYLYISGFVDLRGNQVSIVESGSKVLETISTDRSLLKDKFLNACKVFIEKSFPEIDKSKYQNITSKMREGLIRAFEKRGMEIARAIYKNTQLVLSDNIDILDIINESGKGLSQLERMAFADLMIEILINPSQIMRDYLSALTQGYFSFHALGLDSSCYRERLELAQKNQWIIDSSVILPLFAIESNNFEYANDLILKIQNLNLTCITTELLLSEVVNHAVWAFKHISRLEQSPFEMLQVSLGSPGYKQNLFISGYMKWGTKQGNPSFTKFMKSCIGTGSNNNINEFIRLQLQKRDIDVIDFEKLPELNEELIEQKEHLQNEIEVLRRKQGTFRSISQCEAEAEVIMINKINNSNFISQSIHLNKISKENLITWTPEAMYRFITLLSKITPTKNLLYECMTQDFFYAGFNIIDKEAISSFVSPMTKQSRMELEQEVKNYEDIIGTKRFENILSNFDGRPDEMKPFYSIQTAFYLAREGVYESKLLKDKIQQINKNQKLSDKERQEYNKLKARALEKRRKALKLKRASISRKGKKRKKKESK